MKARLTKKISKSKAWKGGVGTRRGREGAKGSSVMVTGLEKYDMDFRACDMTFVEGCDMTFGELLDLKCDCVLHVRGLPDLKCFTF